MYEIAGVSFKIKIKIEIPESSKSGNNYDRIINEIWFEN